VLVNNAGYGHVCPVEDTPLSDFRVQIETNLFGVITIIEPGGFRTVFASKEAITGNSREIRRRQRRRTYTSPRSPSHRYGCCSEATLTRRPKRALWIRLIPIGTGRISASQQTIRPTMHQSKNR
jgi:hypothetical protein